MDVDEIFELARSGDKEGLIKAMEGRPETDWKMQDDEDQAWELLWGRACLLERNHLTQRNLFLADIAARCVPRNKYGFDRLSNKREKTGCKLSCGIRYYSLPLGL